MTRTNTRNPIDPRTLEFSWKLPVFASQNDPPANPNNGDRYRVLVGTGAWSGHDDEIAIWDSEQSTWFFETYGEGSVLYDLGANDYRYVKSDGTWEQFDKIPLAISDVTGLQSELDDKTPLANFNSHQSRHQEGGSDELQGNLAAVAKVNAEKNGAGTVTTRTLNFKEGANITITVAENAGKTDVTITSTGGSITEYAQDVFRILGDLDATKKLALDVETLITSGNTRTWKVQDADGTVAILDTDQTFQGLVQALTMIATNSITTAKLVLSDLAADPTVNGEIQRNGTEIKAKSNDLVGKIMIANEDDTITIDGVEMTLKEAFAL